MLTPSLRVGNTPGGPRVDATSRLALTGDALARIVFSSRNMIVGCFVVCHRGDRRTSPVCAALFFEINLGPHHEL